MVNNELISGLEGLAKLRLTDSERASVSAELGDILAYMEILGELDTDGVGAKSHAFETECELREDIKRDSLTADEITSNAPDGCFKVPRAFE